MVPGGLCKSCKVGGLDLSSRDLDLVDLSKIQGEICECDNNKNSNTL